MLRKLTLRLLILTFIGCSLAKSVYGEGTASTGGGGNVSISRLVGRQIIRETLDDIRGILPGVFYHFERAHSPHLWEPKYMSNHQGISVGAAIFD